MTVKDSPRPNRRNNPPTPRRPRLATQRPITAPPLNATINALGCPPSTAAWDVRTPDVVAAFIPKKPASMLQPAPTA